MQTMLAVLPLIPIIFLGVLMIKHKKPAYTSAMVMLTVMLGMSILVWQMKEAFIFSSLLKSLFVSLEIALIVWGASILINLIQKEHFSLIFRRIIGSITHDRRIQAILVGWIFVGFVEGIAGFGTPSILAVPLLILFGFSPISAIVVSLLGDGIAVSFGAVGTPILYGIVQGANLAGIENIGTIMDITKTTALIHSLVSWIIPLSISCIVVTLYGRSIKEGLSIYPYIIVSWLCFVIPYLITALFIGPEFPTIIGSLIGGIILLYITKKKIFVPKVPWRFPNEESNPETMRTRRALIGSFRIITPLILVIIILAGLKLLSFAELGNHIFNIFTIKLLDIFGTGINHSFSILKSPFIAFALAILLSWPIMRLHKKDLVVAIKESKVKIFKIILALFSVISVVQLFIYSGNNISGLPEMSEIIISQFSWLGEIWSLLALPFGSLGAFLTGSATVSNLLFSPIHTKFISMFDLSLVTILSFQAIGAAIGNIISIHNIVVACSVGRLEESNEGKIIVYNIIPLVLYSVLAIIVGLILAKYL